MKILAMSDTHGRHRTLTYLPPADLLLHAGDFSCIGTSDEALDFLRWFTQLPYPHKCFVAGNHDLSVLNGIISGLPDNCHQLNYSCVEIEGVKICGIPFIRKSTLSKLSQLEEGVDIIVSHQPPYGHRDVAPHLGHYGSPEILSKVAQLLPKYHVFGHIHADYGSVVSGETTYINCALQGERGADLVNPPILFEL